MLEDLGLKQFLIITSEESFTDYLNIVGLVLVCILLTGVLEIEPRTSPMQSKSSIMEIYTQPLEHCSFFFY